MGGGVICHIFGSVCYPLILRDFYGHTGPHCMAYLGASFLQIWGVGVVRIVCKESVQQRSFSLIECFDTSPGALLQIFLSSGFGPFSLQVLDAKLASDFKSNLLAISNFKGQKRTPKPKNRTNSTKELSEQFDGVTGHYPVKQGF